MAQRIQTTLALEGLESLRNQIVEGVISPPFPILLERGGNKFVYVVEKAEDIVLVKNDKGKDVEVSAELTIKIKPSDRWELKVYGKDSKGRAIFINRNL